jgi:fucose 4-O-acetylase-like acetyltransferase
MSNKPNLKAISFAYAIGTILVVFGHSYPLGNIYIPKFMIEIRTFIYGFHMPLFFFIAGFLLKFSNSIDKRGYSNFIKDKAVKLLTPYFVLSLIFILPKYLVSSLVSDHVVLDLNSIIKMFLIPRENVWGHFWFIPTLFLLYAISWSLNKYKMQKISLSIHTLVFFLLCVVPINIGWFSIRDVCVYGIYFVVGFAVCDIFLTKAWFVNVYLFILAFILAVALPFFSKSGIALQILKILFALSMIYIILYLGKVYEKKEAVFLDWLNGKTFSVFILSWPCQGVLEILLNKLLKLNWYYISPAMFIVGLVMPLVIIFIYNKINLKSKLIKLSLGL